MNKIHKQAVKCRKAGLTNVDLLRMKEIARKEAAALEAKATDQAFLYMLAIPLNVLVNDYWPKTAKQRAPKFIDDVLSLYESAQAGFVSDEELAALLYDMAGIKVNSDLLNIK